MPTTIFCKNTLITDIRIIIWNIDVIFSHTPKGDASVRPIELYQ